MNYCSTIYNMGMIKESNAPEKSKEEKQKEVLRNINTPLFKHDLRKKNYNLHKYSSNLHCYIINKKMW